MLDRHFKTQGIQKTTLKNAKRTASYDNKALNLLHTFFGGPTLSIYKKKGYKILKLKLTYFIRMLYQYSFMPNKKIRLNMMPTMKKTMFS